LNWHKVSQSCFEEKNLTLNLLSYLPEKLSKATELACRHSRCAAQQAASRDQYDWSIIRWFVVGK